ncbi:MAG: glycosyltransferase [Candidatus Heimdallarchaeaceae archaeon]
MSNDEYDFSNLTIIIPTLNEEKTIGLLLEKIAVSAPFSKVIITDDGSKDNTKQVVKQFSGNLEITFLDRKDEKIHGLTISVLNAIQICKTEFFLVMDGDLQHPPGKIKEFLLKLQEGDDLVCGKREKVIGEWSLFRKLMSFTATALGRLILFLRRKNRVKDIMSGFFASKKEIWIKHLEENFMRFELEGYKVLFDFLRTYPFNLKISEIDYVFGTRNLGVSKISSKIIWKYFKSLLRK